MAKIVAVANQKGGVGKTTTAVNLSSCVAALGKKVLIVDLDPQGNTTTGYGISKRSVDIGTYEILIGEADARQAVRKTEFRTDVIGSNTRLAGASLEMIDLPGRESRLRKALAPIQKDYDFIFIDCPPSLDLLTLNGLCACDSILIPVQCEYYALEGLSELISTLKTVRKKYNPYLDIEGVVFTMFSVRYNLTLQVVEQVKKYFGNKVYQTTIPRSIRISEAPSYGQPINFYEPKGKGSEAYMDLAIEFVKSNRPAEAAPKRRRGKSCSGTGRDDGAGRCEDGRLRERGDQWQKEEEDWAGGWKVCLRTPPPALSQIPGSRRCPCGRSSRTRPAPQDLRRRDAGRAFGQHRRARFIAAHCGAPEAVRRLSHRGRRAPLAGQPDGGPHRGAGHRQGRDR